MITQTGQAHAQCVQGLNVNESITELMILNEQVTNDVSANRVVKSREAFRTISEVADSLDLPQHVLRFWESKFSQIRPLKRGGNRRYYRPEDVRVLVAIKNLLHGEGYTIRGVQKLFKEQGIKATIAQAMGENIVDGPSSILTRDDRPQPAASLSEMSAAQPVKEPVKPVTSAKNAYTFTPTTAPEIAQKDPKARKEELSSLLLELKSIRSELA